MPKRKYSIIIIILIILVVGIVGYFFGFKFSCNNYNYKFINKNLSCSDKPIISKKGYVTLKHELIDYIDEAKKEGKVTNVSIYFRDLDNGPTLGIQEHTKFAPASLLKLPLLVTYLSLNEDMPGLLKNEIMYEGTNIPIDDSSQFYKPKKTIYSGITYSVEQMLEYMIENSDNKSYYVLRKYLNDLSPKTDLLKETYVDLGIIDPKDLLEETISVKSYASIFVQLYHSSFLDTRDSSEKALEILSKVDWSDGLKSGVPKDIVIAHKFGERYGFSGDLKQLHDCGIVYYPNNPYLLCIMTQGSDFATLANVIGKISKMTYEEFDSRKL